MPAIVEESDCWACSAPRRAPVVDVEDVDRSESTAAVGAVIGLRAVAATRQVIEEARARWALELTELIVYAAAQGLSYDRIAAEAGCARSYVGKVLRAARSAS